MTSSNAIIIQTTLRPMSVTRISGTEFQSTEVADFTEFFASMASYKLTPETQVFVNRGPGSYSGIRTGISYAYGLFHGGIVKRENIFSFTSFDFIRAATGHTQSIYLKAWPRLQNGKLEGSKGYFEEVDKGMKCISYKAWEEVSTVPNLLTVCEEKIETDHEYRTYSELLRDPIGFRELVKESNACTSSLEPLYINPVHIT